MDRKAVAKQIREAIFDQAEADGRVMHGDAMDEVIEKVLALHDSPAPVRPSWLAPGSLHYVGMDLGGFDYTSLWANDGTGVRITRINENGDVQAIDPKDFYLTNAD